MRTSGIINDVELAALIRGAIKKRTALSVTRFGDGEIAMLNNQMTDTIAKYLKQQQHPYAYELLRGIIETGLTSDYIGVIDFESEIGRRVGNKELFTLPSKYINRQLVDHQAFRGSILGDPYKFGELLNGEPVCIISPNRFSNLSGALKSKIRYIKTPYVMDVSDRSKVLKQLNTIEEHVVLYGCSFMGKDFSVYLNDKIALDYGATLDGWAGIRSRGWFDNLQKHCLLK